MKAEVRVTKNFRKEAKPLAKKYPSFLDDLKKLEKTLLANPNFGEPFGKNAYKIRLQIKSKEKAKAEARELSHILKKKLSR